MSAFVFSPDTWRTLGEVMGIAFVVYVIILVLAIVVLWRSGKLL